MSARIDPATQYANDVLDGRIVAGPHVVDACRRHMRDLQRTDIWFDPGRADRVENFFRDVLVLRGGARFILLPWQRFCLRCIYGWVGADGFRRFRRIYIETAKGSGKSPMIAGMALYALVADRQDRPEVFITARHLDQARILYDFARDMRDESDHLRRRLRVLGGSNATKLIRKDGKGFLQRIAHQKKGMGSSGFNPAFVAVDEFHEVEDDGLFKMLVAGFKKRPEPLAVMITNAGDDLAGPCWKEHERAIDVASGEHDLDSYFSYVCALGEADDPWEDETCWPKTNPGLPDLPGERYIRNMMAEARGSAADRALVDRLLFCRWSGAAVPFINQLQWEAVQVDELSPAEDRQGRPLYVGIDLSIRNDLTSVACVWDMGEHLEAEVTSFVPDDDLASKEVLDGLPYRQWIEDGDIVAVNDWKIRIGHVADHVMAIHEEFDIEAVAYDVWMASQLMEALEDKGMVINRKRPGDGVFWIQHGQAPYQWLRPEQQGVKGLNISYSLEAVEGAIIDKTMRVKSNPVTTQAIMRARVIADGKGNRQITKLRTARVKDDPFVALTFAGGAAIEKPCGDMDEMERYYHELARSLRA